MDLFSLAGDLCHVVSIIILLYKLNKTKSSVGLSGKSQILFALVYSTRYVDIFFSFFNHYNRLMKIFYIIASYIIIFLIYVVYMENNDGKNDTFMSELLVTPAFLLALFVNHNFQTFEVLWTFSIYLEAVAIVPQFFLILKKKEVDKFVLYYLITIGLYRTLYIPHWIYRYNNDGYFDLIADIAGFIYTVIFLTAILVMLCDKTIHVADSLNEERYLVRNIFFISGREGSNEMMQDPLLQEKNDPMKMVYEPLRQEKEDLSKTIHDQLREDNPITMVYESLTQNKEDPRKMIHDSVRQEKEDPSYNKILHVV